MMKKALILAAVSAAALSSTAFAQTIVPIEGEVPEICALQTQIETTPVELGTLIEVAGDNIGSVKTSELITRSGTLFCNVRFRVSLRDDDNRGLTTNRLTIGLPPAYRSSIDYASILTIRGDAITTRNGANGGQVQDGFSQVLNPTPVAGAEPVNVGFQVRAGFNTGILPVPGDYSTVSTLSIGPAV